MVTQHLKQIGKMKKLGKSVPHESDCDVWQNGFYTITGDDQLSSWTEKKLQSTSKSQIGTKKKKRS